MKVLYYDCFCGISGDMNLGALVDLGVDGEYLIAELAKLRLDTDVILNNQDQDHHHDQAEIGHHHAVDHDHSHHSPTGQPAFQQRNLVDIEKIIRGSSLNTRVQELSLAMFGRIARAEAKIHGKPLADVHFHEVGATDSIVDLVGAAIALDYLKVDKIMASSVQVGGGFVQCAHGRFPVPAPATAELLAGVPIKTGLVGFETTTPTGAAILAANVDQFTDRVEFSIERIGYGIGNRDLEIPNVLRVYLGEMINGEAVAEQYILETNIDDMNPEFYSYVEQRLFERGALDVFITPIIMKKGRSAAKLSVLVEAKAVKDIQEVIFRETTSLGLRKFRVEKIMLQRKLIT
jgi:uncharacterized protein (TIGR00299 family) protein